MPWECRGKRLDEMTEIVRDLQIGKHFAFEGRHFRFRELEMCPAPKRRIDILVGGHAKPASRYAARPGDGWVSANVTVAELCGFVCELHALRRQFGTESRPLRIQTMLSDTPVVVPGGDRAVCRSPLGVCDM